MMRHRIEYIALKALLSMFGALPVGAASATGGAIFRTIGPCMGISKVGRTNLARAFPHWTRKQVNDALKGMWDNLGRVVAEYPHLETLARNHVTFRNPEVFDNLRGKPVLYVSGHMANWEVLPPALLLGQNVPVHSAYRAPNNPMVDEMLVELRSFGGRLRSFGKTRKGLGDILNALKNGESVGMLVDQKMNTGIEARFFGWPAMTSTAFVEMTRKLGCPLVPGRIIRTKGCNFEIVIEEALIVGDRPTEDIVADMHTVLEGWIRDTPEQWLWIHRRWKTLTAPQPYLPVPGAA